MSLGTLQSAAASEALVAGVSLVSILLAGDWARVSTLAGQYFLICIYHVCTYIITKIGTMILCSMLLVSSQLAGKCHTLTCINFCGYVGP